jgi:hypothetical protein
MRILILVLLVLSCSVTVASQESSSQTRSQEISASFSKFKSLSKEKNGVTKSKYKDVRSETVVKPNIQEYSGLYEVADLGFMIDLQVGSDGRIVAQGTETNGGQSQTFRLDDAKIEGGLLTAKKVYSNGKVEKFEGAFMTRTVRNSPTDQGVTSFGLGVPLATPFEHGGITYDKLFYQRK